MSAIDNINTMYRYFDDQLRQVSELSNPVHGKLIGVAIIDALAGIRFPTMANRQRFVRVVDAHGGWECADRVSLQQLALALETKGLAASPFYERVHSEVMRWPEGHEITPRQEPTVPQLQAHLPTFEEEALLLRCRYPELLYKFRNALVHQYLTLGSSFDWGGSADYVFYHTFSTYDGHDLVPGPWQLVIPPGFILALCRRILAGVRDHLLQTTTDPLILLDPQHLWL